MYYIFAFKSRTTAMNFYDKLRRSGISSTVINTPPSAQIGCGLSVKVYPEDISRAKSVFIEGAFSSSLGLFRINYLRGRYYIDRV